MRKLTHRQYLTWLAWLNTDLGRLAMTGQVGHGSTQSGKSARGPVVTDPDACESYWLAKLGANRG